MRLAIPWIAAAILCAGSAATFVFAPRPPASEQRPNVAVILVDTLRPGFLGLYGYEEETAPFLAQLAKSSAVFDRAMSTSSWTAPATASVFTSLYPHQHGVVQGFYAHREAMFHQEQLGVARIPLNAIADELTTLPELFKAAGYATFGVAANKNIDKELGFAQGFDRYFQENDVSGDTLYRKLRGWRCEIAREKPFFLYVHLMDPHYPYAEHSPYFERYRADAGDDEKARYLSEISETDRWIERIYKLLRLDRNTLLVVVSDHGEEFGDHGSTQHGPYLYEELQRVVLMVHGPGMGVGHRRIEANVSQVDVLPTLAEFAGVPAPSHVQGVSLWPLMRGEQSGSEDAWSNRVLLAHRNFSAPPYFENWAALRGPWKYIEHHGRAAELFDHRSDPAEQQNLAALQPGIAGELAAAVTAARGAPREFQGEQVQVPVDKELADQLRSLGYVN